MRGQGAKGSIKNRIYQFWLIKLFLKRKAKIKEQRELKEKLKLEKLEKRKREVLEAFREEKPKYILSKTPELFNKKDGIKITLYPLGRKPDRIIEIYEPKRKVGIAPEDLKVSNNKELKQNDNITTKDIRIELKTDDKLKDQSLKSQNNKNKNQYQGIDCINLGIGQGKFRLEKGNALVQNNFLSKLETINDEKINAIPTVFKSNNVAPIHTLTNHQINNPSIIAVSGGTAIVLPSLIQKVLQLTPNETKIDSKKKTSENDKSKKIKEQETTRLKLYKQKLEASKEAEILIKSEIKRQKDYLRQLEEKVKKLDITIKTKYHFEGINKLIGNIFKFALGILTIPFSKNKIFGTMIGVTLINNSIRGIKNSFKKNEKKISYIEFNRFSKTIFNEKMALIKTKDLVVDSLSQIKDLKSDLEYQFYGKVSYDDYEEMKLKLEVIEQYLISRKKEIDSVQDSLERIEEKSLVKMKRLEDSYKKN